MQRYLNVTDRRANGDLGSSEELCLLFNQVEQAALRTTATQYAQIDTKEAFLKALLADIGTPSVWDSWEPKVRLVALRVLKVQGRERLGAGVLFEANALILLMNITNLLSGIESSSGAAGSGRPAFLDTEWERETLKCIANIMLLNESSRTIFSENGGVDTAYQLLQEDRSFAEETQFVLLRILFLATVSDPAQCRRLTDVLGVARLFEKLLKTRSTNATYLMVTGECLKLLYNLLVHLPKSLAEDSASHRDSLVAAFSNQSLSNSRNESLTDSGNQGKKEFSEVEKPNEQSGHQHDKASSPTIATGSEMEIPTKEPTTDGQSDIMQLQVAQRFEILLPLLLAIVLEQIPTAASPLASPATHAVHALLHFPVRAFRSTWFPASANPHAITDRLTEILDLLISSQNLDGGSNERQIDEPLFPLVTLLSLLARDDLEARTRIKNTLFPANFDRSQPVHKGDEVSARIISCMTASYLQRSRNAVGELLFVLHDEDPEALVACAGFGNVAGYFVTRGIQFQAERSTPVDTSGQPINPITGQRFADEHHETNPMADATEEEREREAERLFVLFDRLNRTGVVNVRNPVQQAVEEGRFEELGDS